MRMSTIQTDLFGISAIIILHTIKRNGTSRIATQVQKNNFVSLSIFDIYMYLVQTNYICWNLEFLVFPMSQALVQTRTFELRAKTDES